MIAFLSCGILFWKTSLSYTQNTSTLNRPDRIIAAAEVADRKLTGFSMFLLPSGVRTVASPLEAAPAVHGAPPGGELPGHLVGAAALLLRAAVHLRHQRPGAGQAAGVQLGRRPGRAAHLLPAAQTHRAGGNRSQGTLRSEVTLVLGGEWGILFWGFLKILPALWDWSCCCGDAGPGWLPSHHSRAPGGPPAGPVPRGPATILLHRLLPAGSTPLLPSYFLTSFLLCLLSDSPPSILPYLCTCFLHSFSPTFLSSFSTCFLISFLPHFLPSLLNSFLLSVLAFFLPHLLI